MVQLSFISWEQTLPVRPNNKIKNTKNILFIVNNFCKVIKKYTYQGFACDKIFFLRKS